MDVMALPGADTKGNAPKPAGSKTPPVPVSVPKTPPPEEDERLTVMSAAALTLAPPLVCSCAVIVPEVVFGFRFCALVLNASLLATASV